ncbi:hypothetical protein RB201_09425 [Streptomyces sp. S1A(2023)]
MQIEAARSLLQPELIVAIALIAVLGDALLPVLPSGSLVLAATSLSLGHGPAPFALVLAVATASFLGDLALASAARSRSGRIGARVARHARTAAAAEQLRQALTHRLGRATLAARFVPGGRTVLGLALARRTGAASRLPALVGTGQSGVGGLPRRTRLPQQPLVRHPLDRLRGLRPGGGRHQRTAGPRGTSHGGPRRRREGRTRPLVLRGADHDPDHPGADPAGRPLRGRGPDDRIPARTARRGAGRPPLPRSSRSSSADDGEDVPPPAPSSTPAQPARVLPSLPS